MNAPRMSFAAKALALIGLAGFALAVHAAAPSGNDWFQILANPSTGGDNTGDGGTGNSSDFNYYYVGQSFTGTMQINVDTPSGSNAANIWIDYSTTTVTPSGLTNGSFYANWSGQVVSSTIGRVYDTGFNTSGYSTGQGSFGTFTVHADAPSEANYGTGAPAVLDINTGTIGLTTESNISYNGVDLLDDAEDFHFHVWADTKKPYAKDPSPSNLATGVAIDSNFLFDLRDSKNGEGDDSGVGTGVNTSEPPGSITTDEGTGPVDVTSYDAFSCSGIWGTNLCHVTVDPPSPSSIPGDSRNWNYATTYTVTVGGYKDLASNHQDQLGDTNGPNTMDTKIYTFTTEPDNVAPRVTAETPVRSSAGNSPSTNLTIDVTDRKTYPAGPSGTGVNPATCHFNVSSPTFTLTTYGQASGGVTVTPINYGYRFTIDPSTDFGQNETVSVSAYDCADMAGNIMTTDNWTFSTSDSDAPYVTDESPSNDQSASSSQSVTFHIKDDASGVDLANTVIFFNGAYYTNGGGAGSVTTVGTKITFASSLNFNGGNYVGDTTSRTGTVNDETFVLDPQTDFSLGEAVPIIIYSRDLSGNLMERVVYAFSAEGTALTCPAASSFCGSNTTFNGSQCVGTGTGGSCSTSVIPGSSPPPELEINETTVSVTPLDDTSVLVNWLTSVPASSLIAYDTRGSVNGTSPHFDYRYSTPEVKTLSAYHAVKVTNLNPGTVYFFKPGSAAGGHYASGQERLMAAPFKTVVVQGPANQVTVNAPTLSCPSPVVVPAPVRRPVARTTPAAPSAPAVPPAPAAPAPVVQAKPLLSKIMRQGANLVFYGISDPNAGLTVIVY